MCGTKLVEAEKKKYQKTGTDTKYNELAGMLVAISQNKNQAIIFIIVIGKHMDRGRELTDRKTDRQADRQIDRQTHVNTSHRQSGK